MVIVTTGVSYRRLSVPSLEALQGAGVLYGAAVTEAQGMKGQEVYVVGGGNSAGQAARHLSKHARHVTLLARGESLASGMSQYLIKELEAAENIQLRVNTQVVTAVGRDVWSTSYLRIAPRNVRRRFPQRPCSCS